MAGCWKNAPWTLQNKLGVKTFRSQPIHMCVVGSASPCVEECGGHTGRIRNHDCLSVSWTTRSRGLKLFAEPTWQYTSRSRGYDQLTVSWFTKWMGVETLQNPRCKRLRKANSLKILQRQPEFENPCDFKICTCVLWKQQCIAEFGGRTGRITCHDQLSVSWTARWRVVKSLAGPTWQDVATIRGP